MKNNLIASSIEVAKYLLIFFGLFTFFSLIFASLMPRNAFGAILAIGSTLAVLYIYKKGYTVAKTEIFVTKDVNSLPKPTSPLGKEKTFEVGVVGESFQNDNGTSRQELIKKYANKDKVVNLEFYLYKGEVACKVLIGPHQIGHLPKDLAKDLNDHIQNKGFANVKISYVGKDKDSGLYGVRLKIEQYIPDKIKDTLTMVPCPTCGHQVSKKAESCPNCGEVFQKSETKINDYTSQMQKSRITSFILTVLLGPLGLLYSSIAAGLIMIFIAIISLPTGAGPIVVWILSIIMGDSFTYGYNKKIMAQAKMMSK